MSAIARRTSSASAGPREQVLEADHEAVAARARLVVAHIDLEDARVQRVDVAQAGGAGPVDELGRRTDVDLVAAVLQREQAGTVGKRCPAAGEM